MGDVDRDTQFWAEYRAFWRRPEVIVATVVYLGAGAFAAVQGSGSAVAWCTILWAISLALSQVVRHRRTAPVRDVASSRKR